MGLAPIVRHRSSNSVSPMSSSDEGGASGGTSTRQSRRADVCNCCSARLTSSVLNMLMKKTCPLCQRVVCPSCLVFTLKVPKALFMCKKCAKLASVNFEPRHLMRLHGKELREILSSMDIPYVDGSEKSELVHLILTARHGTAHDWRPSHPAPPISRSLTASAEELASPLRAASSDADLAASAPPLPPDVPPREEETPSPRYSPATRREVSIRDIRSADDIEQLSIRQLKEILLRNSIDYKGCCEKWELAAKVTTLWHSLAKSADIEALPEDDLCKVCMDAPIDCVMLECGHMATCTPCGRQMNECPICRQFVVRVVHTFRA